MKTILNTVIFFIINAVLIVFLAATVAANESVKEGIDVVLLLDISGSMRGSDKSRNAIEAANMFVDMMELKNSRVAVIGFNDTLTNIVDMTEVSTQKDKESIKNIISSFTYDGYTDIGMSLKSAVSMMLEKVKPENSPMILMLTDGQIEINPENDENRTAQASYRDLAESLAMAGNQFPIYTIGLNSNGNVDKELLENISQNTEGRSYLIHEADRLPQVFNEIFADHIKSSLFELESYTADGENFASVTIDIADDFVAEANIIMLSGEQLIDIELYDPDGQKRSFDQTEVTLSKSNKYSLVKVLSPQKGKWLLKTKGVKNDMIRINLIYKYDVTVEMSVQQQNMQNNQYSHENNVTVTGHVIVNGKKSADSALYSALDANLIVTDSAGNPLDEIEASVVDGSFSIDYMPQSDENIRMYLVVKHEYFQKESNIADIQFIKVPTPDPEPAPEPESEPDSDTAVPSPPIQKTRSWIRPVIFILIACLFMIGAVYISKRKKFIFFNGYMEIRIIDGSNLYSSLEIPSLSTYVKKITLTDLITNSFRNEKIEEILLLYLESDKIHLYPGKYRNQDILYIVNNSIICIEDAEGRVLDGKKLMWKNDEKLLFKTKDGNAATLEMTYRNTAEF